MDGTADLWIAPPGLPDRGAELGFVDDPRGAWGGEREAMTATENRTPNTDHPSAGANHRRPTGPTVPPPSSFRLPPSSLPGLDPAAIDEILARQEGDDQALPQGARYESSAPVPFQPIDLAYRGSRVPSLSAASTSGATDFPDSAPQYPGLFLPESSEPITGGGILSATSTIPLPLTSEFQVNTFFVGQQTQPSVAIDGDGNFAIAWAGFGPQTPSTYGVYCRRYAAGGVSLGPEFLVSAAGSTAYPVAPAIAMDQDGDFVVAWQETLPTAIRARRYDRFGIAQGQPFIVGSGPGGFQPAVAMDPAGNFVITWARFGDSDIFAQQFTASAAPRSPEFRVNTGLAGWQMFPAVAMDADGDFVVAWESFEGFRASADVYAQRFGSSGVPVGAEFRLNSSTAGAQFEPDVAVDPTGNFVVVWSSYGIDGSGSAVAGRRFQSGGAPLGSEFVANTFTTDNQYSPSVGHADDGSFVITWASVRQTPGALTGVFGQRYDSSGFRAGTEFPFNAIGVHYRRDPSVAMDPNDGDFVVAVEDTAQDGAQLGIFARLRTPDLRDYSVGPISARGGRRRASRRA